MKFTHLKDKINMVDISKKMTKRTAYASSIIIFSKISFKKFLEDGSPKGEINTARCAGIMAAKN